MAANICNDPLVGRIYELRQSIKKAFGIKQNQASKYLSSSSSSFSNPAITTTTSSKKRKPSRPHTRSCLLWDKMDTSCTLLLITTFNYKNPIIDDEVANSLLLTKDQLSKRLIAIHDTQQIIGRPSIRFKELPSSDDNLKLTKDNYLVLIPVVVSRNIAWPAPTKATFHSIDLLTINKLLTDVMKETVEKQEIELYKKEIELHKQKQVSEEVQNQLDNEKKELHEKRKEIDRKKEEQDQLINVLYGEDNVDSNQAERNNHNTSFESIIPTAITHPDFWEVKDAHGGIFSDSDTSDDDSETSLVETQMILPMNVLVVDWLNKMDDIRFDNQFNGENSEK